MSFVSLDGKRVIESVADEARKARGPDEVLAQGPQQLQR